MYRAIHPELAIDVAIKVPHAEHQPETPAEEEEFLREPRLLAKLTKQGAARHVLQVHDVGRFERRGKKRWYIVMELAPNGSLQDLIKSQGGLDPLSAVDVVRQAALGVEAAHRLQPPVVHCDIKPQNLLLKKIEGGFVVLVGDFGAARTLRSAGESPIICTPAYAAPELRRGEVSVAADVYGLGAVLYCCLAGAPPLNPDTVEIRPLCESRPDLSPGLVAIVTKALSPAPEDRYPTAQEFATALTRWLADPNEGSR